MEKDDSPQRVLQIARDEVAHWREEVVRARERVDKEMKRYHEAGEKFKTASDFLRLVQERYGRGKATEPQQFHVGVGLRDAALAVIEQKGRATREELIAELRARGFEFGKYPARQVHFALLKSAKVVREHSGAWRWKGADQKEMALASEGAREPTKE